MSTPSAGHQEPRPLPSAAPSQPANPLVAFLGPAASFTHQATVKAFPPATWDLCPVATITDVFDQVQDHRVLLGVVPFENSSHGSVVVTFDNLADRHGRYKDISVQGEVFIDVRHCLLGHRARRDGAAAADGDETCSAPDFEHVKQIHSHPQAIGQCRGFISRNLRDAEIHDASSTSRAAEIVRQNGSEASAAISSKLAASIYGLDVLAESIQDRDDNVTRFLIIRNTQDPVQALPRLARPSIPGRGAAKTLVSFTVPHDSPGALAKVLGCFNEYGLNLTSINSRPSLRVPFQYVFFVELDGHRGDEDGRVDRALGRIGDVAESSRWLGSWEARR